MENLIISVALEAWSALVGAKSDLQMHSAFRKPNYPKVEKKVGRIILPLLSSPSPHRLKCEAQNGMFDPDKGSLVPVLHRTEPQQKCITVKYFLIFMKAPPNVHGWRSGESWLCWISATFSCLSVRQGWTHTAYPFPVGNPLLLWE